jgi:hypothetical protein
VGGLLEMVAGCDGLFEMVAGCGGLFEMVAGSVHVSRVS